MLLLIVRENLAKIGQSVKKLVPKQILEKSVVQYTLKLREKSSITESVGKIFFFNVYKVHIYLTCDKTKILGGGGAAQNQEDWQSQQNM